MPSSSDVRPPRSRSVLRPAAALVVVLGALAVAAVFAGDAGPGGQAPSVGLPGSAIVLGADVLTGALLGAGLLLLALVVWALATSPRRKVRARRPWWYTLVMLAVLAVVTLLLTWFTTSGWLADGLEQLVRRREFFGGALDLDPLAGPGEGGAGLDPALRQGAAIAGILFVLLAGALGMWWWLYRAPAEPETATEDDTTERLAAAVDAALDDLDSDLDPRQAILRCYAHLESALAASGVPRRGSETAREHRHRATEALGPGARAAARLVDRFERARYDAAPISEAQRQEAEAALREVRAALAAQPLAAQPLAAQPATAQPATAQPATTQPATTRPATGGRR